MAKTHNAEPNASAPTGAEGIASAGGHGEGADETSLQGNVDTNSGSIFDILGGNTVAAQMDAMAKADGLPTGPATKRATAKTQQTATAKPKRPVQAEADAEDENDEDASPENEQDETGATDGPILPEDDDSESDETTAEDDATSTDDGEEGDADTTTQELKRKAQALEKDNFKSREKLREIRAALEAREARIKELEQQAQSGPTTVNGLPAGFEQARTQADIDAITERYEQALEWAEDNEDGYIGKDAQGNEVEYTPQQVREYRRNISRLAKNAAKARELIQQREQKRSEATEQARKKYPFVLDAASARQSLVQEIEKEFEEIKASPARDLLIGRLVVAKLIESGEYEIIRKSKARPAPEAARRVFAAAPASPSPVRKAPARAPSPAAEEDWAMSLARASMPQAA